MNAMRFQRLAGHFVFLSCGWPQGLKPLSPSGFDISIDEAVVSLVRAVAVEGGSIAMTEHPAFVPLVAFIVGQYRTPHRVEGEESFSEWPAVWVCRERQQPSQGGELHAELGGLEVHSEPLEWFLARTRPWAMVCIGGGREMTREYELFHRVLPKHRIYTMITTGGTAELLARMDRDAIRMDERIQEELALEARQRSEEEPIEREPDLIPYPLIMQHLVEELGSGDTSGNPEPEPGPGSPSRGGSRALVGV
jgi:hypothetical protein